MKNQNQKDNKLVKNADRDDGVKSTVGKNLAKS